MNEGGLIPTEASGRRIQALPLCDANREPTLNLVWWEITLWGGDRHTSLRRAVDRLRKRRTFRHWKSQWASYDEDDACWAHLDYASD